MHDEVRDEEPRLGTVSKASGGSINPWGWLPAYKSHKVVRAVKIRHLTIPEEDIQKGHVESGALLLMPELPVQTEGFIIGKEFVEKHKPRPGGYFVAYQDGYTSYSPAAAFESGYTPLRDRSACNLDFSEALIACKEGARIARSGWNGQGMWVALSPGKADCTADELWSPASKQFALETGPVTVRPYLIMKTVDGQIVPWLASQTDLLATDWVIL